MQLYHLSIAIGCILLLLGCSSPQAKKKSEATREPEPIKYDSAYSYSIKSSEPTIDSTITTKRFYKRLSDHYNFQVDLIQLFLSDDHQRAYWKMQIFDKQHRLTDSFTQQVITYSFPIEEFTKVRSFTTGFNKNKPANDGDYGVLVLADFNFDGKEDFALMNDININSNPYYTFYIQRSKNVFKADQFLTDSMSIMPDIDFKHKRLITYQRAWANGMGVQNYGFRKGTTRWYQISHVIHRVDTISN